MQDGPPMTDAAAARRDIGRPTMLLREIQQLNDEFSRHLRSSLTVNATDLDAMQHLIEAGSLSPSELARRLELSSAAVTSVVDRLEHAGHARRERHPTDRRALLVVPSQGSVGRALGEVLPMAATLNAVLDRFSQDEQTVITRYLDEVVAAYRTYLDDRQQPSAAADPPRAAAG